jgi:hypothetical protein
VRPRDRELGSRLEAGLRHFSETKRALPGIQEPAARQTFVEQLLESIHRVRFVAVLRKRKLSPLRAEPQSNFFDPLKAAILHQREGNNEEAFWLVFLFVHFGRHVRAGWRYAREVYGRINGPGRWDWASTSADPAGFRAWLDDHQSDLKAEGQPRGFGNHRKYESLDAYGPNGTGAAVETYVNWVSPPRTHQQLMNQALQEADANPKSGFDILYHSMKAVARFGRTARFDYLTMIGKLNLASIEPPSTYMVGATGPMRGARLLFGTDENPATLDQWLAELDADLLTGMQVLEDALCNWQKSPEAFIHFRG